MRRGRFNILMLALVLVAGVGLAILISPRFADYGRGNRSYCLSNIKQLGTSTQLYLADNDDRLPPKGWASELKSYYVSAELLTCERVKEAGKTGGYALNFEVMGVHVTEIDEPQKTVFFFETDALGYGIVANLAAQTKERHGMGSNVCFADFRVKFIRFPKKP